MPKKEIKTPAGQRIETVRNGGFCGEDTIISRDMTERHVYTVQPSSLYFIENDPLLEIPVVHWKLLETSTRRREIVDSLG